MDRAGIYNEYFIPHGDLFMKFVGPSKKRPKSVDEAEISHKIQKSTIIYAWYTHDT